MFDGKLVLRLRDPAWIGSRARNAARRPIFIGIVASCVVVLAILSIALTPRHRRRLGPTPSSTLAQVDTASLIRALALSKARVGSADSALVIVRQRVLASTAKPRIDSLNPALLKRHDSLTNVLTELQSLIGKVENAPLPTSYRALAASPALISNPKINALLDSLGDVERDRESFGSTGGADPMFVALTSRLTEIGRSIEAVAAERRDSLRSTITLMTAPSRTFDSRAEVPDTMPWIAERDSAVSAVVGSTEDLAMARRQLDENRRTIEQAQEIKTISASPFSMVIAAAVLGIVFGFAGALRAEIRGPTVADGAEVERSTGARLMSTVVPMTKVGEPERRRANRVAPKYLDSKADSYQLAYLHLEQSSATPDIIAVLGDDADVNAIVAMNLAAIAADDARAVLVIDAAGQSEAIRSLLPMPPSADLVDVVEGRRSWATATASVSVGRDKLIDVVTGVQPPAPVPLVEWLRRDAQSLGKRYDTVFLTSTFELVSALAESDTASGIVITATVGRTRLSAVVQVTTALRERSRQIFGVVLWNGAPPRLAGRPKRRAGGDRKAPPPLVATPRPSKSEPAVTAGTS